MPRSAKLYFFLHLPKYIPFFTPFTPLSAHDRFLEIDEEVYHIGHSLKDLGKKRHKITRQVPVRGIWRVCRFINRGCCGQSLARIRAE